MKKQISLIIILVLFVMFSISAVCANDANVTDVGTASLADDSSDASVVLENTADSSEISASDVADADANLSIPSISDGEVLESDSNDLSINTAKKVTMENILVACDKLKSYYADNGVLPETVDVGNDTFTIHEFYYLMSKATSQLNKSDNSSIEPIYGVEGPSSKCNDTVFSAAVTKDKFVPLADEAVDYITENNQVADHVYTVAGKIAYEDYVSLVARILSFYHNNGALPNYVKFLSNDPSKVNYTEEGELNPFGLYGKMVWIDADGGSDEIKWEIAAALEAAGWDVYVGNTYANAHFEDYLNAYPGSVLINIYNGFCAGTMRELVTDDIQNLLNTKHIVCVPVWDTSLWTNTEGMAPYRYGNYSGYSAKRAWDDDFSHLDPSIKNVDQFFRFYNVTYCTAPTCALIVSQFVVGGYYKFIVNNTVPMADILEAAAVLKDSIASGIMPDKVNVGGTYYSTPEFLYMMSVATGLLGSNKSTSVISPVNATFPLTISNNATGALAKDQYIDIAFDLVGYISSNSCAPDFIKSSIGNIGYPELVDAFSTIMAYYNSNSKLPNQVVIKACTNLVAEYEKDSIVATVRDDDGNPVSGIRVGFDVGEVKYVVTDANGQAKFSTSDLDNGKYNVKVRGYGNASYANSNLVTVNFTQNKIATNLAVSSSVSATLNSSKYVLAILKDANGNAIKGAKVAFVVNNKATYVATDANGRAKYSIGSFKEGSYDVKVGYFGNDTYKASNQGTCKVTINKIATQLSVSRSVSATPNSGKSVLAILKDANGNAIKGAKVAFVVNNKATYVATDANGRARFSIGSFKEGSYDVKVGYFGNATYKASNIETCKVTINKIATQLSVTGSVSATLNSGKSVLAILKDANGNAIKGAKVAFVVNNKATYVATDANGRARFSIDSLKEGSYTVKVGYFGNDTYMSSNQGACKVTIKKIATQLSVSKNVNARYRAGGYVLAILKDAGGKVIKGAKICFVGNGKTTYVLTDANGKAKLSVNGYRIGTTTVQVGFFGTDIYKASDIQTSTVTIRLLSG